MGKVNMKSEPITIPFAALLILLRLFLIHENVYESCLSEKRVRLQSDSKVFFNSWKISQKRNNFSVLL